MRGLIAVCTITSLFVGLYWTAILAGIVAVDELVPGYRAWFMAFPVADAWIALWAARTAFALWKGREAKARGFALLTGSALVFLGLYAFTYGVSTGLVCRQTLDEYIEIGIKAYCLTVGGWLVVWGLQSPPGADGTLAARAHATSP